MRRAKPDLVVLSGDFVQNGFRREFEEAQVFLRHVPRPWLAVPGNHDLPFTNILKRFTIGLDYYRHYISPDIEPFYQDPEIAVMGVNTARYLPLRGGRINHEQVEEIERRLCSMPQGVTRILVTHHPFDLEEGTRRANLVGRARMAMGRLAQSVDILMAGHMHLSQAGHTGVRYMLNGASAVFVQAGTATSTRGKGEPNAFNLLRLDGPLLRIERHHWSSNRKDFECQCVDEFTLDRTAYCSSEADEDETRPKDVEVTYSNGHGEEDHDPA